MEFYTNVRLFGNKILYRGYKDGERVQQEVPYYPTLYLPSNQNESHRSLDGRPLKPIKPGSIKDCKDFVEQYKDIDNFDVYGNNRWHFAFIREKFPESVDFNDDQIVTANIDIEVDSSNGFPSPAQASEKITAISVKFGDHIYAFGYGDFKTDRTDVTYIKYNSEYELLLGFLHKWQNHDPDIVTGWNIKGFDIPYLINRITNVMGEPFIKRLSPWGRVFSKESYDQFGNERTVFDILGVSIIDYMDAYKKFTFKMLPSYRLDYVAWHEKVGRKLEYDEYSGLHDLCDRNHQKFIEYNIQDVELVEKIDGKKQILRLIKWLAYRARINLEDPFSQVRMWDTLIFNRLMDDNIVIPISGGGSKTGQYEGAYVKEPEVGFYNYIASFDLDSLYPHLIMQYNISPDTFVPLGQIDSDELHNLAANASVDNLLDEKLDLSVLRKYDLTLTPNGQFFRTDKQGFLAEMMEDLYNSRKEYKALMKKYKQLAEDESDPDKKQEYKNLADSYKIMQEGMKVTLNSAYGALGNQHFRFYDTRMAAAITTGGQLSIRWSEKSINEGLNSALKTDSVDYVPYIDTDSNYVNLEPIIDSVFTKEQKEETDKMIAFMDKVCDNVITPMIMNGYKKLAKYVNAFDQKMSMKREVLADTGFWTGKKRYALNVWDDEGVKLAEPDPKIMGLEVARSSTPEICRDALEDAINLFLNQKYDELIGSVEKFETEMMKQPAHEVACPRTVKNLAKYKSANPNEIYIKGTPLHVRGSLLYNHLVKKLGLEKKYPLIQSGDKIKFTYLRMPNPLGENVMAFPDVLPEEFELDKYVDNSLQYVKNFKEPLQKVVDCSGWSLDDEGTLDDFFV